MQLNQTKIQLSKHVWCTFIFRSEIQLKLINFINQTVFDYVSESTMFSYMLKFDAYGLSIAQQLYYNIYSDEKCVHRKLCFGYLYDYVPV